MFYNKSIFINNIDENAEIINEILFQSDSMQFISFDSIFLNEIFYKNGFQKVLVFRYFGNECFSCIVDNIEFILKWHFADVENNHVVLLTNMPRTIQDSILISSTAKGLKFIGLEDSILKIAGKNILQFWIIRVMLIICFILTVGSQ